MRVVVDTNVLMSGIFWGGKPGRIIEAWAAGLLVLVVSAKILEEYFEVLDRIAAKMKREDLAARWKRRSSSTAKWLRRPASMVTAETRTTRCLWSVR